MTPPACLRFTEQYRRAGLLPGGRNCLKFFSAASGVGSISIKREGFFGHGYAAFPPAPGMTETSDALAFLPIQPLPKKAMLSITAV